MHRKFTSCLLALTFLFVLAACSAPPAAQSTLPGTVPVPPQSQAPSSVPTVQVPAPSADPSEEPVGSFSSDPPEPSATLPPNEDTTLTFPVNEESVTVPAVKRYTEFGYSIVYDSEHYALNNYSDGEGYWSTGGNYLSMSMVYGMPVEDVLAGLRLQENIAMEPETASVGSGNYTVLTLYMLTPAGLYRQFWVMELGSDVLLIEQSFDTFHTDASIYQASQLAMLETLTLLN